MLTLEKYEKFVQQMLVGESSRERFALALAEEVGELAGKVKRIHRGDYKMPEDTARLKADELGELGDILFYLCAYAACADINLNDIIDFNYCKLKARQKRNTIKGEGDNR